MTLIHIGKPKFDPKAGPPCHDCPARCCKYFALAIDTPITPEDHDHIRWYLLHQHVVVWMQEGDWYLEVRTPCKELLPDNRCAIYDSRPQICRTYGWPDKENPEEPCDYFSGEGGYDLFFATAEEFDAWSKPVLARREARLAKRRKSAQAKKQAIA